MKEEKKTMRRTLSPELRIVARRERLARWRRSGIVLLALAAAVALLTAPLWWERSIAFEPVGNYNVPGLTGLGWYAVSETGFTTYDDFAAVYAHQTGGSLDKEIGRAHV